MLKHTRACVEGASLRVGGSGSRCGEVVGRRARVGCCARLVRVVCVHIIKPCGQLAEFCIAAGREAQVSECVVQCLSGVHERCDCGQAVCREVSFACTCGARQTQGHVGVRGCELGPRRGRQWGWLGWGRWRCGGRGRLAVCGRDDLRVYRWRASYHLNEDVGRRWRRIHPACSVLFEGQGGFGEKISGLVAAHTHVRAHFLEGHVYITCTRELKNV